MLRIPAVVLFGMCMFAVSVPSVAENVILAETMRISDQRIHFEVTVPEGRTIRMVAFEGELSRLHFKDGPRVGLAAVIDPGNERVRFKVFDLTIDHVTADGTGLESIRYRETVEVPVAGRAAVTQPGLDLFVSKVETPPAPKPAPPLPPARR